jgi:putative transposase
MGRPLRISYPGAFYHVTSRGNERRSIYQTSRDFEKFIGYLESATERYGARIHCFCLMTNHYHLLLETPRGNLQAILHHLNTGYTNYFNTKKKRVGHLFQGRYKAILVEKDHYALELSRYIHLNPVRAQLVKDPIQYPWSSYSAYGEKKKRWSWLETDFILSQISRNKRRAIRGYREYTQRGIAENLEDPLKMTVASTVIGSEKFIEWVREKWVKQGRVNREVPAIRKLTRRPDLSLILHECERRLGKASLESRRMALYLCHHLSGLSLREIGEYFGGISISAVSQNSLRQEKRLKEDTKLSKTMSRLKESLSKV